MPGGQGGWESDTQATWRRAFRGGYDCFRQSADRDAGVWSPSGQACASGDGPEEFKVCCGQGPIVLGPADRGAHDLQPVACAIDGLAGSGAAAGPGRIAHLLTQGREPTGEGSHLGQQGPPGLRRGEDAPPLRAEPQPAARPPGEVGVQQVPAVGERQRRGVQPPGEFAARSHPRLPSADGVSVQGCGRVDQRLACLQAGPVPAL